MGIREQCLAKEALAAGIVAAFGFTFGTADEAKGGGWQVFLFKEFLLTDGKDKLLFAVGAGDGLVGHTN